MSRVLGIVTAVVAATLLAGAGAFAAPPDTVSQPPHAKPVAHARAMHHRRKAAFMAVQQSPPDPFSVTALPPDSLSAQEQSVSRFAEQNGDRDYLMVDKTLGKILLFENGKPMFSGAALTGQSTADRLPKYELTEKMARLDAVETKVTPAGRFTVTRGYDPDYGPLFDVNQIKGKDWGIAIHKVYLGIPSEHRDLRLVSPNEADKHITFGCINVAPETVQLLLRELPADRPTVLYVLPEDDSKSAMYFAPRNS